MSPHVKKVKYTYTGCVCHVIECSFLECLFSFFDVVHIFCQHLLLDMQWTAFTLYFLSVSFTSRSSVISAVIYKESSIIYF